MGDGKRISCDQADKEVAELGEEWRLESSTELYALVDRKLKNANGACSSDESLQPDWHWTSDESNWSSEARVVVLFYDGCVSYDGYRDLTALARAVRVSGQ
ncbi:MAG: hypothetical protein ACREO0_02850 [Pseudoxanthomonas sp.]